MRATSRSATVALSICFVMTGIGVALPGAALPALLTHWSLQDRGGGMLFLMAWLGSTGGAVLARGNQLRSVVRGALLVSIASLLLAVVREPWIYPTVLAYGIGLGITMTSVSVLRAQQTAAAIASQTGDASEGNRHAAHLPAHEMNRLNMLWALGALSCPALAAHSLHSGSPGPLLVTVGVIFGVAAAAVLLTGQQAWSSPQRQSPSSTYPDPVPEATQNPSASLHTVPLAFAVFAALAVGVESALGGWLTTYTQRTEHGLLAEVTVASAFWAGLLLSRAWHTTRFVEGITPGRWLQIHAVVTLASVPLIAITHDRTHLLAFALLAGIGLGPLYPMTLGFVLPRFRGRFIFVLAGLGSAFFPWLTGLLSTELHSIRGALIVCCLASLGLAALSLTLRRAMLTPLLPPCPLEQSIV